jgi:hypothetical protein
MDDKRDERTDGAALYVLGGIAVIALLLWVYA